MDAIEGVVGANSIGEAKKELAQRGASAEFPTPTYGYMGKGGFYTGSSGGNLLHEWVTYALRGVIYTEKIGRSMSADTFICQIPWRGQERIGACRRNMGYTRGVALKDGPFEKLAELQIDTIDLKMGMLLGEMQGPIAHRRRWVVIRD